jgi:hypothetical protein
VVQNLVIAAEVAAEAEAALGGTNLTPYVSNIELDIVRMYTSSRMTRDSCVPAVVVELLKLCLVSLAAVQRLPRLHLRRMKLYSRSVGLVVHQCRFRELLEDPLARLEGGSAYGRFRDVMFYC